MTVRSEHLIYVPIEQAVQPANGEAIVDAWWTVDPLKGVVFYAVTRGYLRSENVSPQCNHNEATCRLLTGKLYPECEIRHIPVVFVEHAERQLRERRKASAA
jgi:hypothetical protein